MFQSRVHLRQWCRAPALPEILKTSKWRRKYLAPSFNIEGSKCIFMIRSGFPVCGMSGSTVLRCVFGRFDFYITGRWFWSFPSIRVVFLFNLLAFLIGCRFKILLIS